MEMRTEALMAQNATNNATITAAFVAALAGATAGSTTQTARAAVTATADVRIIERSTANLLSGLVFVDPSQLCEKSLEEASTKAVTNTKRDRDSTGLATTADQFSVVKDLDPERFVDGSFRIKEMYRDLAKDHPSFVGCTDTLDIFQQAVGRHKGSSPTQKVAIMKAIMRKHPDVRKNQWLHAFQNDSQFVQKYFMAPFQLATERAIAELRGSVKQDKRRPWDEEQDTAKSRKRGGGKGGRGGKGGKGGKTDADQPRLHQDTTGKVCFSRLRLGKECKYPDCKFSHTCPSCGKDHTATECERLGTWK